MSISHKQLFYLFKKCNNGNGTSAVTHLQSLDDVAIALVQLQWCVFAAGFPGCDPDTRVLLDDLSLWEQSRELCFQISRNGNASRLCCSTTQHLHTYLDLDLVPPVLIRTLGDELSPSGTVVGSTSHVIPINTQCVQILLHCVLPCPLWSSNPPPATFWSPYYGQTGRSGCRESQDVPNNSHT